MLQKELDEIKEIFSKFEASKFCLSMYMRRLKNEWLIFSLSKFSCREKDFGMVLTSYKCVLDKKEARIQVCKE